MAITDTKNILVAEDWKKVYKSFKSANFRSYDFESLRKAMVDYLRTNYPEDFNDFIESSEYVALIDLIAFLGQSLAYRTDLNARENFIDTAERRDSILKLARLISYTPKRVIPASGLLKITNIRTTESLSDSDGINIANIPIAWDDSTNDNWLEQFALILNATLVDSQLVGRAGNSQVINGIKTDEYAMNLVQSAIPVFGFSSIVDGRSLAFEAVSATTANKNFIYEKTPEPSRTFNILYRSDNNGNGSINTGFFLFFKQGTASTTRFSLSESLPNRVVPVAVSNINNSDLWLHQLDALDAVTQTWTPVPAISSTNIIYHKETDRKIYQVVTKANDQIDLVFGDGSFSDIPQGDFIAYYRISEDDSYKITPDEMQGVRLGVQYVSRSGKVETLTITASLQYTVANAVPKEDTNDIRQKAPQHYYAQNRMITGEDYNVFPFSSFSNILKIKATNRTSSGISRLLDVIDTTGKYSSTNIFADDGALYKKEITNLQTIDLNTFKNVERSVYNTFLDILADKTMSHYYYEKFATYTPGAETSWQFKNRLAKESGGYFYTTDSAIPTVVGPSTGLVGHKHIEVGAIVKFTAPAGQYFDAHNDLISGTPSRNTEKTYLYATVTYLDSDGTAQGAGVYPDGTAPVTLSIKVPSTAVVDKVYPQFKTTPTFLSISNMVLPKFESNASFGLGYNNDNRSWGIYTLSGNWLVSFTYSNGRYEVRSRGVQYIFESTEKVKFYFDENLSVFDSKTGKTVQDQIVVLRTNTSKNSNLPLDEDLHFKVYKNITENDGYEADNKILVTYPDSDVDLLPDNPEIFTSFVDIDPDNVSERSANTVFFQRDGTDYFAMPENTVKIVDESITTADQLETALQSTLSTYEHGQVFYNVPNTAFYVLAITTNPDLTKSFNLTENTDDTYTVQSGRAGVSFQYKHNSPNSRRIDPSPTNIMDLYVLTKRYDEDYRVWVVDSTNATAEPVEPTTEELATEFASLENYKPVSDTIIFHSARFKPLFGIKAATDLQATIKVIRNPASVVGDNDIKASVVSEINNYFAISNIELGQPFYFSELSAYIHSTLGNVISSVTIIPKISINDSNTLYQINAEPGEILISAAKVEDVVIVTTL